MVEVCEDRGDKDGVGFWQWVVLLLNRAGHEFMSDEEDMWYLDETGGSGSSRVPKAAKQVLHLKWRHSYFTKLFTFIEVTTGVEEMIFHHAGRPPMPRIRVEKESTWPPPPSRPKSFFNPSWLANRSIVQRSALQLDDAKFDLRDFEGYMDS
ncbi:hypothetical protein F5878DRAFT_549129 [Lentinula raphanica]|uniref:Uncharacterized protein n=1 Tax=Lentinula raphanica TaxID=153919 RepID=A0AA38NW76_9AGAR|nr:hypothetical protein F5878DRAFT_549129 [Lentinula raphanica]